ncbi:MAG: glucosidase, partial [Anaerolineae bacterium]|nr:glucosidase [Anaerolineae bacterium]
MSIYDTNEGIRLELNKQRKGHWNRWGPFLSERAWGTVREDYSADGDAWDYFPHDHARSRVYRWNEDGLGGICDRHQTLCFALGLWNGNDPFLKERMFGLTGSEGNHGEDLKEYYFYLDNTPTHSYMKMLYKYPHAEFPYQHLIEENQRRSKAEPEYELVDTGIFDNGRYFDITIEYAKVAPEDILIRISISNRGPEAAPIHLLPTLWFRNTWSWGRDDRRPQMSRGATEQYKNHPVNSIIANHWQLGEYILYCPDADELLFTENETNSERLFGSPSPTPFVKDAFHNYVVDGHIEAVNPAQTGTKAVAYYQRIVPPGETVTFNLRLAAAVDTHPLDAPLADFDDLMRQRQHEADAFYEVVLPAKLKDDVKLVARQAFAGQLWSKQFYHYIIGEWLEGDPAEPTPPESRLNGRNHDWTHLYNA